MFNTSLPKRLFTIGILISALSLGACNKHQGVTPAPAPGGQGVQATMVGNWHIDSVNTFFYYTDGSFRGSGVYVGQQDYYFHFQADHSWEESFTPDVPSNLTLNGSYTLTSDSTFTLKTPGAIDKDSALPCKILSLSQSSFVFSKRRTTVYDGTLPGYMDYVFHMKKQ